MADGLGSEVERVCNLSESVEERGILKGILKGRQEGLQEGFQEGFQEGRQLVLVEIIRKIMQNASFTFEQAVATLGIPVEEQEKYRELLAETNQTPAEN